MSSEDKKQKTTHEAVHYCPLLDDVIAVAYCYEINSVAFGLCKPSLVNNVTTREEAEPICEKCDNKAM